MAHPVRNSILLFALTTLAFAHVCGNGFIDLDDGLYITANPHVLTGLNAENIHWAFTTTRANFWHPVTWLSLQLDATLYGPDAAWGFHLTNLLLHLANVVLLYRLLAFLTRQDSPSFWAAALFAVHPLHVESVAWATERKDVLSTLFWLLTTFAYAWYARKPRWERMALTVVPLALGLMTKPMLVTLPFTLLLLDYWPMRRWPRDDASPFVFAAPWRLVLEKTPLFLITFVAAALALLIKRDLGEVVALPLQDRAANAVISCGWYLWKTVLPSHLGVYYPHPLGDWSFFDLALSGLVLVTLSVAAVRTARSQPYLLVGWLWFLGTLVPVIGLVQVGEQARGDRFVYVPHIGLSLAVVWFVAGMVERRNVSRKFGGAVAGGVVLALAVLTWFQVRPWRDVPSLWEHTDAVTAGNHRAKAHLGAWLIQQSSPRQIERAHRLLNESLQLRESPVGHYWMGVALTRLNRLNEAIPHYRRAIALQPHYPLAHHNLGVLLANQGQIDEAIEHFRQALEGNTQRADSHLNLGMALMQRGAVDEAAHQFQSALESRPGFGRAETQLGVQHLKRGDFELAEAHFRRALDAAEADPTAEYYLGLTRVRQKKWTEAIAYLSRAAAYHPRYRCCLAYAQYESGNRGAAREQYAIVSRQLPTWPTEFAGAAFVLATHPDPKRRDPQEAFEMATQSCQATDFRNPELLVNLAATLAARGDFEAAVRTARDARKLADGNAELTQRIENHLKRYERKEPLK